MELLKVALIIANTLVFQGYNCDVTPDEDNEVLILCENDLTKKWEEYIIYPNGEIYLDIGRTH